MHTRYRAQNITTLAQRFSTSGPAANMNRLKQLQIGQLSCQEPVLLYWPKSVPQSSSITLKLRFTVGMGNKALSKVSQRCATWAKNKSFLKEQRSLIKL